MTSEQQIKCHSIIHSAALACAGIGAGLSQILCSDSVAIVPIQITMIISLGAVFGIRLNQSAAEATLATATATSVGRSLSQIIVGWIPGIGNIVNASTAIGITEIIGFSVASDFDKRKSLPKGKKAN